MRTITSRQNPIVQTYRDLSARRRNDTSEILLDGEHLLREALGSGLRIRHVAVLDALVDRLPTASLLAELARAGAEVVSVSAPVMRALSPVQTPSGLVAIAERSPDDLDRLLSPPPPLVLVAVDVQDPGNLGAIVRAAEAAGATGVTTCGASADPFGWKALRGSMGSALRLPLAPGSDCAGRLTHLQAHGLRIVASIPRGGQAPASVDLTGPLALVIGGEGQGLTRLILDHADQTVTLPMKPPVESLNVAVAAALLAYEACRQRSASAAPAQARRASSGAP